MSAAVPEAVRQRVRRMAGNRCGYCLSRQEYVLGILEVEHTIPRARGGTDDETNLWLACSLCNLYKGAQTLAVDPRTGRRVKLFNPRAQRKLSTCLRHQTVGIIEVVTPPGRAVAAG